MANNPLSRFFPDNKTNIASDTYRDFYQLISSSGDFSKNHNLNTILNSWRNILMTPRGTYDHDPTYGSDLYKMVMRPLDDFTESEIRQEILNSIAFYDNRAMLKSIDIFKLQDQKGFMVRLIAEYNGQQSDVNVTITTPT